MVVTHPFVDVIVLQLNEASADGGDVALLVGKGHAAGSLRIFQLWVSVDTRVTNAAVQTIHDHRQLHCRGAHSTCVCSQRVTIYVRVLQRFCELVTAQKET